MSFIIKSADDALRIVNEAIRSHASTWNTIDKVEDFIIRLKPIYDRQELKKKGVEWVNNWAFGKGRGKIERIVNDEVKFLMDALNLIDIEFEPFNEDKHKDKTSVFLMIDFLRSMFSRIIGNCFVDLLDQDERFHVMLHKIEYNTVTFGYCPVTKDQFSYLGTANSVRQVAFEDRTTFYDQKCWVTFDIIKGQFLLEKYKQIKGLKNTDWKEKALLEIVKKFLEQEKETQGDDVKNFVVNSWEDVDRVVRKIGYAQFYYNTNNINIAKIYQVINGDLHETYIAISSDISRKDVAATSSVGMLSNEILFRKIHKKKNIEESLCLVKSLMACNSEFVHELSGIGKIIAEDDIRFNRNKNSVYDKLLMSGSPYFTEESSLNGQTKKIMVVGGYVMLPDGIALAPNQMRFDLSIHQQQMAIDDQQFSRDTQHYQPTLQGRLSNRPNKDEVRGQSAEVASQVAAKAPVKLSDYGRLLTLSLLSLIKDTFDPYSRDDLKQEKFKQAIAESLKEYSIEVKDVDDILKHVKGIKLSRPIGNVEAIQQGLQMATGSNGRRYLTVCYLIALGFDRQDIRVILEQQDGGSEIQMAALENAAFFNTGEVVFGIGQDHISHLNTHFGKLDRILQGVSGGEDPIRGFNYLTNALPHTQRHVQAIGTIPFYKKELKQFLEIQKAFESKTKVLAEEINKMKKQAAQAQQEGQQQQQQQMSPEVMAKINTQKMLAMEKIRRTNDAHEQRSQQRQVEFEQRMKIKESEASTSLQHKQNMEDLKIQVESLKGALAAQQQQTQQQDNGR